MCEGSKSHYNSHEVRFDQLELITSFVLCSLYPDEILPLSFLSPSNFDAVILLNISPFVWLKTELRPQPNKSSAIF